MKVGYKKERKEGKKKQKTHLSIIYWLMSLIYSQVKVKMPNLLFVVIASYLEQIQKVHN